jgi:hypothetical protein
MDSTNSYQLKQEEDNYILSITMLEESIKLSCDNSVGQIYSKIFTLEDLRVKDKIFANIQNTFDAIDIFDDILKNEKVRVVEDESGNMQILLYIASEDRNIELELEKELDQNNAQEEQGFNNEMKIGENQMEQNVEINEANLYQNLNTNVEPELNVNEVNINENMATNYEEYNTTNVGTINTNENIGNINTEQFDLEEFLKNTQPEVNANMENNAQIQMNNINIEENNSNYIQNENININNEFNNINTANTQETNPDFNINNKVYYSFGIPSENTTNIENIKTNIKTESSDNFNINATTTTNTKIESSDNYNINTQTTKQTQTSTNTNIFSQPRQEKSNAYSIPYITPADPNPQPQPQPQPKTINQEYGEFSSSMTTELNTANVVVPTMTQTTTTTTKQTTYNTEKPLPKPKTTKYHEVSLSLPKDKKDEEEEKRINKFKGEQSSLKNQHTVFNNKITELTNLINSYRSKIAVLQSQKNANELESLRAENARIKQQLAEIGKLRKDVAEAQYLRNQLSEYEILKQKAAQVDSMKSQLSEINNLKMKIAELSGLKSRMDEMRRLKEEINRLNNYNTNSNEINNLRAQIAQMENMKQQLQQKAQLTSMNKKTETKMSKTVIKGDIIHDLKELEMLTRKINKSNNKIILNLLYKATADSDSASSFHQKCDKAESTLVLVESDKGKRFGGFTSRNWRGEGEEKKDPNAFVFSLDKMKIYDNIEGEDAIGCFPQCGPVFMGCQIRIYDNAFKNGGTTFERGVNYETEEDYELTGGERAFGIKEIEVYEVIVE